MKPKLKSPGTKHLTPEYDPLLSTFAFKFNWRRYNLAETLAASKNLLKAAEVYRTAIDAEWSGDRPSPTLLKGLVDSLDKEGRCRLTLSNIR